MKELNSSIGPSAHQMDIQFETAKRKLGEEALHGALRIAGLASVLTSNGYLVSFPEINFLETGFHFNSDLILP